MEEWVIGARQTFNQVGVVLVQWQWMEEMVIGARPVSVGRPGRAVGVEVDSLIGDWCEGQRVNGRTGRREVEVDGCIGDWCEERL